MEQHAATTSAATTSAATADAAPWTAHSQPFSVDGGLMWSMGIGFSSACDLSCRFCYSETTRRADSSGRPLSVWERFIAAGHDQIAAINYGTGENTLADDWFALIHFVRSGWPHIPQALTTNGHLAAALRDVRHHERFLASIDEVDVSLDYADRARHDALRGREGTHAAAVETLQLCADVGKKVTVVVLGVDETLEPDNLEGLFAIAAAHGALVRVNVYRPYPGQPFAPPQPERLLGAVAWIVERHEVVAMSDPLLAALFGCSDGNGGDPSGSRSLRILPGGEITPSTYLTGSAWIAGSIEEENVLDRLGETEPFRALREASVPASCSGCAHASTCAGGTYDRRILHFGTLAEADPYCPRRTGVWPASAHGAPRAAPDAPPEGRLADDAPPEGRLADDGVPIPRSAGDAAHIHAAYLPTLIFAPR